MATSGFLQDIFNKISLQKNPALWLSHDDSKTTSRIQLLAQFEETRFAPQLSPSSPHLKICSKNVQISKALKEKGNLFYAQGDNLCALQLFNQSLQFCPAEEVHKVLAKRSAILEEEGHFTLAIEDIDQCLSKSDKPDETHKLLERKAQCLASLERFDEAIDALEQSLNALETVNMNRGKLKSKQDHINRLRKSFLAKLSGSTKPKDSNESPSSVALDAPHPTIPRLSDALDVVYGKNEGRYCVAKRDIQCGELIAVDKAFTWMLDKSETKSLCWTCLRPVIAPIPCAHCSGVLFCGGECEAAAKKFHKYECGLTEMLYQANIGAWALAFRAIIQKPHEFFWENRSRFETHDEMFGASDNNLVDNDDIWSFHNLVSHDNSTDRDDAPGLMMQSLTCLFLLRCLQFRQYLPSESKESSSGYLNEQQMFFARLIHHFMRAAYYNTHEVIIVDHSNSMLDHQVKRIGRATNPSLALFNHSCNPNYRRICDGTVTYGFATRNIKKGDEVCDTYCPLFVTASKDQRCQSLQKYKFKCQCMACRNNWPILTELYAQKEHLPNEIMKKLVAKEKVFKKYVLCQNAKEALRVQKEICQMIPTNPQEPQKKLIFAENNLYHILLHLYGSKRS